VAAELTVLDGSTHFLSAPSGDVEAAQAEGFFHADMRHLSLWRLLVDGEPLRILTSRCVDYYSARIVGLPAAEQSDEPAVSVRRDRFVADGFHEDLVGENASSEPRRLRLELRFGSDFADILECKRTPQKRGRTRVELEERAARLVYERGRFRRETAIGFTEPCQLAEGCAIFELELAPHSSWKTCVNVTPVVEGRERPPRKSCDGFGRPSRRCRKRSSCGWTTRRSWTPRAIISSIRTGRACSTSRRCGSNRDTSAGCSQRRRACPGSWRCSAATA
jgi:hypothetical protein